MRLPRVRARGVAVAVAAGLLLFGLGCCLVIDEIGGASSREPSELAEGLSPGAKELLERALDGLPPGRLVDHHVHVVGLGTGGTGAFVNPDMRSWLHPIERIRFSVYADASGIDDLDDADRQYVARLVDLIRNIEGHGRYRILAFDKRYRQDGTPDLEGTEFHVPNEYVHRLAERHPDCFLPSMSVHPYRKDALEELERWAKRGVGWVKWLPNAMGIDPSDERCEPFYRRMKELGLVLLTHTGEEKAVHAEEDQRLGNPLLLRKPLDMGVTVVAAHCAGLGRNEDLDDPERGLADNFDLFLRLMAEKRYEGRLFGDVSALTHARWLPRPLAIILARKDLHHRLVYGSDYPLPAINVVVRTRSLVAEGFVTEEERKHLNEIYEYNPLLFDLAVKRAVKHPETGARLPATVFTADPGRGE
ncbi:MAG: amidohydrolase family protein [Planctomycetota bacterium]